MIHKLRIPLHKEVGKKISEIHKRSLYIIDLQILSKIWLIKGKLTSKIIWAPMMSIYVPCKRKSLEVAYL